MQLALYLFQFQCISQLHHLNHFLSKFHLKFIWNCQHNDPLENTHGLKLLYLNAPSLFQFSIQTRISNILNWYFRTNLNRWRVS